MSDPRDDAPPPRSVDRTGQVALVTGGASGIGLATCRALRAAGAKVACADIDADAADRAAADHDLVPLTLDVGDPGQWTAALARVDETCGPLDIAVLNAGLYLGIGDLTELAEEDYRRAVRVNVDGVVWGVRACGRAMRGRGGAMVATASLAGLVPTPYDPVYTATKHAVVGLCRAGAAGLSSHGIRLNAVCPGYVDTPLLEDGMRRLLESQQLPLLTAEDVAEAVLTVLAAGSSGEAWYVQPGRPPEPYGFRGAPGPR